MIDGLYRQWARTRSVVNESDPLVLRIYALCRQDSEASLPQGNNGAVLGAEEVERQRSPPSHEALPVTTIFGSEDSFFHVPSRGNEKIDGDLLKEKGGVPQWMSRDSGHSEKTKAGSGSPMGGHFVRLSDNQGVSVARRRRRRGREYRQTLIYLEIVGIPTNSTARYDPNGPSVMIQADRLFRGNPTAHYDEGDHPSRRSR